MPVNYFEQLLEKIDDQDARTQLSDLAAKHAVVNDWIVDPELRGKTEQISQWAESEWDYEHGMSKLEFQQTQQLADLQRQLEQRGNGMELKDLDDYMGRFMSEKKLMTQEAHEAALKAAITEKENEFNRELGITSIIATRVPYLNAQYQKDFGKMFDPDEFLTQANEKGYAKLGAKGLDEYYKEFTAADRKAKEDADIEARAEALATERFNAKMTERGAQTGAAGMTADGGTEMSAFQARVMGLNKTENKEVQTSPVDMELGRNGGSMAKNFANQLDAKDRSSGFVQ